MTLSHCRSCSLIPLKLLTVLKFISHKLLADSSGDSEETVVTKETVSSEETAVVPTGNDKPVKKTKKKGKPRGGNNWLKPENIAPGLEAGDNTKFLSVNMALMNMPDIDMENPLEVQQRLSDYFALYAQYDMKPTVVGMAIALKAQRSGLRLRAFSVALCAACAPLWAASVCGATPLHPGGVPALCGAVCGSPLGLPCGRLLRPGCRKV